jgi:magnesium transporter
VLLVFYTARTCGVEEDRDFAPVEIHIYISGGFILTLRHEVCVELDRLHETLVPEGTEAEEYLVYRILDGLTDSFYPIIDAIEQQIDRLEGEVLERARQRHLGAIYRLKQEVHDLYRRVVPQRDLFQATGADTIGALRGLSHGSRLYLRDVAGPPGAGRRRAVAPERGPHRPHVHLLQRQREPPQPHRREAERGRHLFVAWTLVTGFFGQNFGWLVSHIDSERDFLGWGIGGLLIPSVVLGVYFWPRREDWL